jgi:MFS family permease
VLLLTWISTCALMAFQIGGPFLAESAYGFSRTEKFALVLLTNIGYIPSALFVGPALRRLAERTPWLSTRDVLAGLITVLSLCSMVPFVADALGGDALGRPALWGSALVLGSLSGAVWPIVESYLSGARRAQQLRRATGLFNLSWASAGMFVLFAMSPFVSEAPLLILLIAGLIHLGSLACIFSLTPEPAKHLEEHHEPHPPVYRRLLVLLRFELPLSYVVLSAIIAAMPDATAQVGVHPKWRAALASTWMVARLVSFWFMQRGEQWHGRWRTPLLGGGLMLVGFALALLAPLRIPGALDAWALTLGLTLFGLGQGVVYAAAIYYAMEVGSASVDAGGTHEAVIGGGYLLGPLAGLAAGWVAASPGQAGGIPFDLALVAIVGAMGVLAIGGGAWLARRAGAGREESPPPAGTPQRAEA